MGALGVRVFELPDYALHDLYLCVFFHILSSSLVISALVFQVECLRTAWLE